MAKDPKKPQKDILEEKYRGPNGIVSALGYGAIETKVAWLIGLVGGGIAAFIFHGPVNRAVAGIRGAATKWSDSENGFFKAGGGLLTWLVGRDGDYVVETLARIRAQNITPNETKSAKILDGLVARREGGIVHALSEEILKIPGLKGLLHKGSKGSTEQVDAAIMGGGLSSLAFIIGSSVIGSAHGAQVAERGKSQFKRAQQEVRELREDVEFLEEKNAELRHELRNSKEQPLHISKDDVPRVKDDDVRNPDAAVVTPIERLKRKDDAAYTEDTILHSEKHAGHTHHSQRHAKKPDTSHGEQIRGQKAAAKAADQAIA